MSHSYDGMTEQGKSLPSQVWLDIYSAMGALEKATWNNKFSSCHAHKAGDSCMPAGYEHVTGFDTIQYGCF